MLKRCFYIWCVTLVLWWCADGRANDRDANRFLVIVFLDQGACVGSEAVENVRVDTEDYPVQFQAVILESGVSSNRDSDSSTDGDAKSGSAIYRETFRQRIDDAGANAGLWFHCGSGTVYLTAAVGNTWLDERRRIEVENDQLNVEGLSAVVHGWLDALIPQWRVEKPGQPVAQTAISKVDATPKQMPMEAGVKKMPSSGAGDAKKELAIPEEAEKTETKARPRSKSEADQQTTRAPRPKPKKPKKPKKPTKTRKPREIKEPPRNEATTAPSHEVAEERAQHLPKARHLLAVEGCATGVIAGDAIYVGGGALFFELRPRKGSLEIYLKGSILGKMEFDNAPLNLTVRPWPFGMGARWAWIFRSSSLTAGVELEGLVNQYVTYANDDSIQKGASFQLSVLPMLGGTIRVFRFGYIAFRLGTRVAVYRPAYTARVDGEMQRFQGTPPLQPMAYIGIGFDFL